MGHTADQMDKWDVATALGEQSPFQNVWFYMLIHLQILRNPQSQSLDCLILHLSRSPVVQMPQRGLVDLDHRLWSLGTGSLDLLICGLKLAKFMTWSTDLVSIASLCQLWSVETIEQFAASTDGRDMYVCLTTRGS